MSAVAPLSNILSGATRNALQGISKLQGPAQTLPKTGISEFFSNLFKGFTPVASQVTKKATIPSITSNLLSKTNVITTGIFGTTALLSLTQGGQNFVETTGQGIQGVTNLGQSINDMFTKNPILPIGLLILGGLVVVSVIKK